MGFRFYKSLWVVHKKVSNFIGQIKTKLYECDFLNLKRFACLLRSVVEKGCHVSYILKVGQVFQPQREKPSIKSETFFENEFLPLIQIKTIVSASYAREGIISCS